MINSEFRRDIVSGDWILFAPGRLRRPAAIIHRLKKRIAVPKSKCPFENPFKNVSKKATLRYGAGKDWEVLVLQNRYPAVEHYGGRLGFKANGPQLTARGAGHHDLLITKSHTANFPALSPEQAYRVFEAFRDRYLMLSVDKNISYISIFQNWGPLAGATVHHPHYQMISIPIIPPDVMHSLNGSDRYFRATGKCPHCTLIGWEKDRKKRIIFESGSAVAFAPFVSRNPFEIRVYPKRHLPYFENTFEEELRGVAAVLQKTLNLVKKNLNDPDYNLFFHTAPVFSKSKHKHYHWHIEIYPKLTTRAGFEFGTGMEINIVDPDKAAEILRRHV